MEDSAQNTDFIEDEDEDVQEERKEIAKYMVTDPNSASGLRERVVAVQGLRKEFKADTGEGGKTNQKGGKKMFKKSKAEKKLKIAVRNLSFGVDQGETFGLLGHNGAGKTTTMRVITAEEAPTCGRVKIGAHNITSNMSEGFELLGYCPQVQRGLLSWSCFLSVATKSPQIMFHLLFFSL